SFRLFSRAPRTRIRSWLSAIIAQALTAGCRPAGDLLGSVLGTAVATSLRESGLSAHDVTATARIASGAKTWPAVPRGPAAGSPPPTEAHAKAAPLRSKAIPA